MTWQEAEILLPLDEDENGAPEVTPEDAPNANSSNGSNNGDSGDSGSSGNSGNSGDAAADGMRALGQAMRDARDREKEAIAQFEEAEAMQKPVVLYVYCGSHERKYERAVEECSEFESAVLGQYAVTVAMQDTVNIRLDGCDLSKDLRKVYKLSKNRFPQLLIYDFQSKKLASFSSNVSPDVLVEYINAANEHCEALAAKLDR